tara:strand:+ start:181 stop:702 length:522 start_codon:yes stop_codon:yes gene_type:complete
MRQLKQSTIKRYTGQQLANHLDLLGHEKYRVMHDEVWILSSCGTCYYFHCSTLNKDAVLECVENVYYLASLQKKVPVNILFNKEEISSTELPLDGLAISLRDHLEAFFWGGEVIGWTDRLVYQEEDFSLSFNFEGDEYEVSLRNSITPIPEQIIRSIELQFDVFKPLRFLGVK